MSEVGNLIQWRPEQIQFRESIRANVLHSCNSIQEIIVQRRTGTSTCIAEFAAKSDLPVCVISTCARTSLMMKKATCLFGNHNVDCYVPDHNLIMTTKAKIIVFDHQKHMLHSMIDLAIKDRLANGTKIIFVNEEK